MDGRGMGWAGWMSGEGGGGSILRYTGATCMVFEVLFWSLGSCVSRLVRDMGMCKGLYCLDEKALINVESEQALRSTCGSLRVSRDSSNETAIADWFWE